MNPPSELPLRNPDDPGGEAPRRGDAVLLLGILLGIAASALPGALRAIGPTEPPRVDARPIRIDLNRALPADLSALPGVGPSLAARIAEERTREPFRDTDDLRRVAGIGPSLAGRIGAHADFDPAPPDD